MNQNCSLEGKEKKQTTSMPEKAENADK